MYFTNIYCAVRNENNPGNSILLAEINENHNLMAKRTIQSGGVC